MKIAHRGTVERDLGRLFDGGSVAGLGEDQLLARFVERRDEPAFAALVARHGPMVLGVCRRFLADPLDVEDAFQATFLVLVRRAGSLQDRDRLAPWLFGVARKVATRARMDLARRKSRERPEVEVEGPDPRVDDPARELGRALVEEIDRLPEALRDPILLCCVEGLTYDEAASRLLTTAPAVRGKLSRAREQLRTRLTRRGFAPSAIVLGALLSSEAASAAVSTHLVKSTIQTSLAGALPAGVEALAEGVIRTMIMTKSKFLATTLVAFGLAGSTVGVFAQQGPPPAQAQPLTVTETPQLNQIEKKLDRLIEALEGSNRAAQGTRTITIPDQSGSDGQLGSMGGRMMVRPGGTDARSVAKTARTITRDGQSIKVIVDGEDVVTDGEPLAARVTAMEKKLARLESRLAAIERRLGEEGESEDAVPTTTRRRSGPVNRAMPPVPVPPAPPAAPTPVPTPG